MNDLNWITFLILGLIIGSFLNVVILRMDDLKTIVTGRSHCQSCQKNLRWIDLIPLISFAILRGKCRYCGGKISLQYPLVELVTGIMYTLIFVVFGFSLATLFYILIFSLLMVVAVYDIKTQYVPETLVWIILLLSLFGGFVGHFDIIKMFFGVLIGGGLLASLVLISKEKWMGAGDIKIGIILGLLTGLERSIVAVFIAFLLGSIVGLIYIYIAKKTIKAALPFAPFLIFATLVAVIWGNNIVNWYLGQIIY
ncbi:MAG: prepilin peptidase [bacterium]